MRQLKSQASSTAWLSGRPELPGAALGFTRAELTQIAEFSAGIAALLR
jgi:hypothetical protein